MASCIAPDTVEWVLLEAAVQLAMWSLYNKSTRTIHKTWQPISLASYAAKLEVKSWKKVVLLTISLKYIYPEMAMWKVGRSCLAQAATRIINMHNTCYAPKNHIKSMLWVLGPTQKPAESSSSLSLADT